MATKPYNEIKASIDKSSLTSKNKKILHNINKLLSNYDNNKQLQLPILILTKDTDNTDMRCIEKLIADMLKKYNVFGGKLKDTVNLMEVYYKELIPKIEKEQAYKIYLDNKCLNWGNIESYLNTFEQIIDTKCVFILLECMQNTLETLNEHSIYPKADYILSNNSTVTELANRLLDRYKKNEISTDIDTKELKELITSNLKTEVYKTDEICLQYMYSKSLKSYISSNKKKLDISNIPVFKENENIGKNEKKQTGDISQLVGLEYIKNEVDKIIKFATFNQQARKENPGVLKENLNMCFLGNPGTGKTTVARLIAKEFYKNKIIKKDKVTEVLPNDLMGEYVGWTKRKTREVLDKAKGGILFIDEAYQIASADYSKGNNTYMQEALTELLKYMENPDNIVIFAGYKEEIEDMININPRNEIKNRNKTRVSRLHNRYPKECTIQGTRTI